MMNNESGGKIRLARERTLENIHAAAIAEFSEKGFQGATTQAIARRAGLKKLSCITTSPVKRNCTKSCCKRC